jgi:hypothetical protein
MAPWIEVRNTGGDVQFINPVHIVSITLIGTEHVARGAVIGTVQGEIETHDPASVERLRRVTLALASQGEEGHAGHPTPPQAEPPGADPGQRAAQDAATRGEYDEDEALRRFDAEGEREGPS